MEVQYKAEFNCKLVNSSYGVKMFINGVYIGCQNSTDNRMKELINSELEKHEIPKHEPKSMTKSRKRKIEKNKQMLEHSKKVRDFLNKYYAGERTYTYLGKGENSPLDYEPIV